jgi:DNA repair exonuclease SbcCD ATPase subunit
MKISKLRIRNLFGIKEFYSDGKDIELTGKNGVCKSAVIDAIKYALTNKSEREYIILAGEQEGEVFIQTDTGLSIHRKSRTNKADYKSIKQEGDKIEKNESFVRELFTELQLNPVEFSTMPPQEQNRIILDLIDFKWDLNWIRSQFGEIPPDVNYEQNILGVLHEIQDKEGYYFKRREEFNREARNKQAFIEEIAKNLPDKYDAEKWESVNLGELYKKIEAIRYKNNEIENAKAIVKNRDNRVRSFQAELEIEKSAIDKEATHTRTSLEKQIVELENKIKAYKKEIDTIEEKKLDKIAITQKTYDANVAELEGQVKEHEELAKLETTNFNDLQEEAENTEKMKSFVNEYKRMIELKEDVDKLVADSQALTEKIEKARTLPGEILATANIPIEGLSIKDGLPLINGLPISNLSEGEKFELCIGVATRNSNALQMILIDGIERLATAKREKIYANLKEKGVQFVATRTTDEDTLHVVEL